MTKTLNIPVQHPQLVTPGAKPTPSQLKQGQLAINLKDLKLYTLDNVGSVQQVGVALADLATVATSGNYNDLIGAPAFQGDGAGIQVATAGGVVTVSSNGTSNKVANTLVMRDSGGSFTGGDIKSDSGVLSGTRYGASPGGLLLRNAQGSSAAPTAVVAATDIGVVSFQGYSGTTYQQVARIDAYSDGAITDTSAPGNLRLLVTPSGAVSPVEKARLTSAGNLLIGTTTDDGVSVLQINGQATVATTPPLFNKSSKVPNTAYVQQELGSYSNYLGLDSNTTLTASNAGSMIQWTGFVPGTFTLPLASIVKIGGAYHFYTKGSYSVSIVTSGTDKIWTGLAYTTSVTVNPGESLTLVCRGSGYYDVAAGTAALQYTTLRPNSLPIASAAALGAIKVGSGLAIAGDGTLSAASSYVLPIATSSVLGGVKAGATVTIAADGTIDAPVPMASASVLGGIKIGSGVTIDGTGTISVTPYSLPTASASIIGGVKIGSGITIDGTGTISATPYSLPISTTSVLGGVKAGTNVSIDTGGVLSVPAATAASQGVMQVGSGLSVSAGTVSVAAATASVVGGVKPGNGLTVTVDGTLYVNSGITQVGTGLALSSGVVSLAPASAGSLGGVLIGSGVSVDGSGRISVAGPPIATSSVLGVVKVPTTSAVSVDVSGNLTVPYLAVDPAAASNAATNGTLGTNTGSIAIGGSASSGTGNLGSIAIGQGAATLNNHSVALGMGASGTADSVAIGYNAKQTGNTGSVIIGSGAQSNAVQAVAVGYGSSATGTKSIALGNTANITTAISAVAIGDNAAVTSGSDYAVVIGAGAGGSAGSTVALGYQAAAGSSGAISIGSQAKGQNPNSIAIGYTAMASSTGAIAIGPNTTATIGCTSIGSSATSGSTYNTVIGYGANATVNAGSAVAIGYNASVTAGNSVAIGAGAIAGSSNIAIGSSALAINNSTGTVGIGYQAGQNTAAALSYGVILGYQSGQVASGNYNILVGYSAGMYCQAANSIAIGMGALKGASATPITGKNIAIGQYAQQSTTTGSSNVSVGDYSLSINSTGVNNVAIGTNALNGGTGSNSNVAVGYSSATGITTGGSNVVVGSTAGQGITTAQYNTAIGYGTMPSGANYNNCTALGYQATVTADNQVQLGNSSTTTYVYGTVQNRSDARDKYDVQDTQLGLSFIMALRPVDYKWDLRDAYQEVVTEEIDGQLQQVVRSLPQDRSRAGTRFHHGLIAQEVKGVMDRLGVEFGGFQDHNIKGGRDVLSIGYDELLAPLIKAVQEQQQQIETQGQQLKTQQQQIEQLLGLLNRGTTGE